MKVRPVDPRDESWIMSVPDYRVYFHDHHGNSDEYQLSGADVSVILEWAEAHKESRTYVLYACVPRDGLGLLRLAGRDPNNIRPVAR